MMRPDCDVVVIGAGMAGLFAAKFSRQRGFTVACVEEQMFGGTVLNVAELDPLPAGFTGSGADIAASLMTELTDAGMVNVADTAVSLGVEDGVLHVRTSGAAVSAHNVIVASGARAKRLGVPGEDRLEHRGVAHCADCDAAFYTDQDVVVVGGGDSALQEALVLSRHCRTVIVLNRGGQFRGRASFLQALRSQANVRLVGHVVVQEIFGDQQVEGVRVHHQGTDLVEEMTCAGVFPYVGLEANTRFVPLGIARDGRGFLRADGECRTALEHVLAIGAVRSGFGGSIQDAIDDAKAAVTTIVRSRSN